MVEDEYGTRWLVAAGDPANDHINLLKRNYVSWVVLPREVLMGTGHDYNEPADVLRAVRLADCLEVING